nr:hypothetical protein BaRGS_011301 [Batillaria attramentaria]
MNRLNTGVNDVEVIVRQGRYELQDMMCKRGVLTRDIRDRHALLQAAIDRYRDEALASLDDQIDDIKAAANLDSLQENLDELTKLQQRMHKAVDSGAGCELVTVAREMRCGCFAHKAFDADANQQLFVVLEEAQAPDLQRTVRLYRRPQPDAIATYSPPVAPFQPSDVCFYALGGHEVLLVADELNDAIHVVNVQDGRLSFARYLAPGCPLLVQPTALNTDTRGSL